MAKGKRLLNVVDDPVRGPLDVELFALGELQQQLAEERRARDAAVLRASARYTPRLVNLEIMVQRRAEKLRMIATKHRGEILDGDAKTIKLPAGQICWRESPPKIEVENEEAAVAALKRLGLDRFIRTVERVARDQALKEPDVIAEVRSISIAAGAETIRFRPLRGEEVALPADFVAPEPADGTALV